MPLLEMLEILHSRKELVGFEAALQSGTSQTLFLVNIHVCDSSFQPLQSGCREASVR